MAKANTTWIDMIQRRIDGASAAGDSKVLFEFSGNQFGSETAEQIRQVLIESGYTVALRHTVKTQTYSFNISW